MKSVKLLGILMLLLSFYSCSLEEALDLEELEEENEVNAEIYYRWTEDLSYPANSNAIWCNTSVAADYNNSHTEIPDAAVKNQYYGPLQPGSFQIDLGHIGGGQFNGTLSLPQDGYRRYYTHLIKDYNSSLNRCIIVFELSYFDEPL